MQRLFILGLTVGLSLVAGAAQKSGSSAKQSAAKQPAASAKKGPANTKAKAKAKTPVKVQQPSPERYTEIQQALAARGYAVEANGVWGADSVAALKKFQGDQNLTADGKLGALSLMALGLGPRRTQPGFEAVAERRAAPVADGERSVP